MIDYSYVSILWKHLSYDFLLVAPDYVQFIYPLGMLIVYDWLCKTREIPIYRKRAKT